MAGKKKQVKMSAEAALVTGLFGAIEELDDEELDLIYVAVAPAEDPTAQIDTLSLQAANSYQRRRLTTPGHLLACRQRNEIRHRGDGDSQARAGAGPNTTVPPGRPVAAEDQGQAGNSRDEEMSEVDRRSIAELAGELGMTGEGEWHEGPAAHLADLLLDSLRISGKPNLEDLCSSLGLRVREKRFRGFDGVLVRGENEGIGIIGVNSLRDNIRKRFAIAHEIGHYLIPNHCRAEMMCPAGLFDCFSSDMASAEIEANEFAAGLLLPRKLVRRRFDLTRPSLSRISLVANELETSVVSATRRFLALTREPCAMVWSRAGRAVWFATSNNLTAELPMHNLPVAASLAGRLFAGKPVAAGMQRVDANMWFSSDGADRIKTLLEESIAFPAEGAVLTLLWAAELSKQLIPAADRSQWEVGRTRTLS